jgi:hypothetical protein
MSRSLDTMKVHARLLATLRTALRACAHYDAFTRRLTKPLEHAFPGYTVRVNPSEHGFLHSITIWGADLPTYEDRLYVSWSATLDDHETRTWLTSALAEIDRHDTSDSIERAAQEETLVPEFATIDLDIARLRARAAKLVADLPVPTSATVRAEKHFWDRPSSALRSLFPNAFGRIEESKD